MRMMYEMFITSNEDWMQSSIMMNVKSKTKGKRRGKHVWKKYIELVEEPLTGI